MSQFAELFKDQELTKKASKSVAAKKKKSDPPLETTAPPAKVKNKPKGKSSDDHYTQVLTYIKKDTHNAVKATLIFDEQKRDLSDLVQELLSGWVKQNGK